MTDQEIRIEVPVRALLLGLVAGLVAASTSLLPPLLVGAGLLSLPVALSVSRQAFLPTVLGSGVLLVVVLRLWTRRASQSSTAKGRGGHRPKPPLAPWVAAGLVFIVTSAVLILPVTGAVSGAVLSSGQPSAPPQAALSGDLRELTLSVPGWFCPFCSKGTESIVGGIPGVVQTSANLGIKELKVVYDPSVVSKEEIYGAVAKLYSSSIMSDEPYRAGRVSP